MEAGWGYIDQNKVIIYGALGTATDFPGGWGHKSELAPDLTQMETQPRDRAGTDPLSATSFVNI